MTLPADLTTLTIVAGAIFAAIALVGVLLVAHATAFSRNVDRRRVRHARFQDDWRQIIEAAGDFARAADRRSK